MINAFYIERETTGGEDQPGDSDLVVAVDNERLKKEMGSAGLDNLLNNIRDHLLSADERRVRQIQVDDRSQLPDVLTAESSPESYTTADEQITDELAVISPDGIMTFHTMPPTDVGDTNRVMSIPDGWKVVSSIRPYGFLVYTSHGVFRSDGHVMPESDGFVNVDSAVRKALSFAGAYD